MDREEQEFAEGFFKTKKSLTRQLDSVKTPITIVSTTIVVLLLVYFVFHVYHFFTDDKTVISNALIREEVVYTDVLKTADYNFTQILFINDAGNPINLNNPITSNLYVATIDGTIPVYVNLAAANQHVDRDLNGNPTEVSYELPRAYPGEVALDESTTKKYAEQAGIFGYNAITADDVTNLRLKAQEEQLAKLCASGRLENAEAHTVELITNRVQALLGKDVKVTVTFTGDTQSTYTGES